ncbi:hypothetical protein C9439_00210 [archaeon SCG-AAA382B04]|nr:hypothetical protein C9439_00210 [archaeon SCG-AAA382B04]
MGKKGGVSVSDNFEEKKQRIKDLLSKSEEEGIENVKEELKELLDSFSPLDLPEIEQELVDEGKTPEEISKLCDIHVELFKEGLENKVDLDELEKGHPLHTLIKENNEITNDSEQLNLLLKSLKSVEDEDERKEVAKKFQQRVQKLLEIDRTHYEKLEMLAFPHIERRGISSVPRFYGRNITKTRRT